MGAGLCHPAPINLGGFAMSPTHIVFALYADGDFDQLCYSEREAKRERRDLETMGFIVKVRKMTLEQAKAKGLD